MAYFKDSPYAQQRLFPRMVSSVRAPLLPDGYQGDDTGYYTTGSDWSTYLTYLTNPWVIGVLVILIIIIVWYMMKS